LLREGKVVPEFAARRAQIERQLAEAAQREGGSLGEHADLLEEVTALVEHPSVYVGRFDAAFLEVPQECLILTMRQNQKYFPLFDAAGKLLPRFLIVSNMDVADARHIVGGNERVVRPRLEDARFFYNQDRKTRLEARVPQLAKVVYHGKLGSQLERVQRIQLLSGRIARALQADPALAERAAWLAKADLLTGMVGEFPELQGIMGRYYALHDGEPREVADAIEAHYRPRFAGDRLPEHAVACAVALADKLDALCGLFGIGQAPTGDRDPFGLRRAALGVLRIVVERRLPLSLSELLDAAFAGFSDKPGIGKARTDLMAFVFDRARGYFQEAGYSTNEVEAVLSLNPLRLDLVPKQLEAVRAFSALPEAESLAAANKRIGNILKQAGAVPAAFDAALMTVPEEKSLHAAFSLLHGTVKQAYEEVRYTDALRELAALKAPVDAFFDKVMVMDKDPKVRDNRIGFLGSLHATMNRIADLSKLAQ
jgi:glycyl-tRNA synthetase beta chain